MAAAFGDGPLKRLLEQVQLAPAADQRGIEMTRPGATGSTRMSR